MGLEFFFNTLSWQVRCATLHLDRATGVFAASNCAVASLTGGVLPFARLRITFFREGCLKAISIGHHLRWIPIDTHLVFCCILHVGFFNGETRLMYKLGKFWSVGRVVQRHFLLLFLVITSPL